MKSEFPFDHHGISGGITLKLHKGETLDSFCERYVPGYNANELEVVALRIFAGKEIIITVYALDKKAKMKGDMKLPVRKFKTEGIPIERLFSYIQAFNLTVSTGQYDMDDMEVIYDQP